ncbi:TRAP transporter large permease [Acuticoccus kandeliae]|uniref:TRAP transporter large permease n=1 Tax=Acuticoccus kandeliae TaxID=2073160 RepID=UPI000D3E7052|nr:TRAP transporter large permease [Acuticoccus kandeliae]
MLNLLPAFLAAVAIGTPVAFAVGAVAVGYILISGQVPLSVIPTVIFGGMDSFPLLAIPFFIMAGDLASRCGVMPLMVELAKVIIGPVRGSLAYVNIASSMMFGGVTGVAVADTAAVGGTLIPAMTKDGYTRGFSAAVTAASSVMGAIIPPSVGMLIIAYIYGGGLSVTKLFLYGATPGLLIGFVMMGYVALVAKRRNFPGGDAERSLKTIMQAFWPALPGLGLPVVVLGGIIGGIFTPTEAGAVAVAYALALGVAFYRNVGPRAIGQSLLFSAKTSAVVFLLLGTAKLVAFLLVINLVPQQIGMWLQSFIGTREGFLLMVVLIFLLLGTIMEAVATMIILVPIVAPMAPLFGVEGHHLALVIVMTVQIALITPPMAIGLFIVCPLAGCTVREVSVEVIPFIISILLVVVLVVFVPSVASWLPAVLGY